MAEKLVCVRPDATHDFQYKGGTFRIGVLPRSIYAKFIDAGSKQLKGKASGEEMLEIQTEIVRYGVKGHTGLEFDDGEEVPFRVSKKKLNGVIYEVVDDATIEIYYATGLLSGLFSKIIGNDSEEANGPKEKEVKQTA